MTAARTLGWRLEPGRLGANQFGGFGVNVNVNPQGEDNIVIPGIPWLQRVHDLIQPGLLWGHDNVNATVSFPVDGNLRATVRVDYYPLQQVLSLTIRRSNLGVAKICFQIATTI